MYNNTIFRYYLLALSPCDPLTIKKRVRTRHLSQAGCVDIECHVNHVELPFCIYKSMYTKTIGFICHIVTITNIRLTLGALGTHVLQKQCTRLHATKFRRSRGQFSTLEIL